MIVLRMDFAGERQLSRAFSIAEHDARDLREPLGQVADLLQQVVGEQFRTEGGHSLKWPELSDGYREWKDEHYPGRPILVRTAALRQAFLVSPERTITAKRLEYGPDPDAVYEDGTSVREVADAHQAGEGHQRQRKIVNLTAADRREIDRVFADWAAGLTRRIIGAAA